MDVECEVDARNQNPSLSKATMHTSRITGPQGELAVYQLNTGKGIPLLFVHADSGRAAQWEPVMSLLPNDRRLASFDFRGHGESAPAEDEDYGFDGRATDIDAVAKALGWPRLIIVAHSAGAGAALAYAARHSRHVAGLLMIEPPTDPRALPRAVRDKFVKDLGGARSLEVQKAFFKSIAGTDAIVTDQVLADAALAVPAARVGVARALADWNPEQTLNAYQGPMFVLSAQASDTPAALYRARTDVPYRVIPNAGHWLQLELPSEVVATINEFVEKVEAAERKKAH